MGEEKNNSNDNKKLVYEMPRLVQLNVDTGEGLCGAGVRGTACVVGSGAVDTCGDGNAADVSCTTGDGYLE